MLLHDANPNATPPTPPTAYRFDIFKAIVGREGQPLKVRSVGTASLLPGTRTYHVKLRTFLNDEFFLLPEDPSKSTADYAILTREPSRRPGRKYYWHRVGEGFVERGANAGSMRLCWDMLGAADIYMALHPFSGPAEDSVASA
jgi:hypothetical protein